MPSGSGPGQAEGLGPDQSPRKQGQGGVLGLGLSHTARGVLSFSVLGALEAVDSALEGQSPEALLEALQDPALALRGVRRGFADWYLQQLSSDREQKAQVGWARPRPLQHGVGGPYSKSQTPQSGTGPVGQASLPQGEAGGVAPTTLGGCGSERTAPRPPVLCLLPLPGAGPRGASGEGGGPSRRGHRQREG